MENWLYKAKECWQLHQREIKRYGLCSLLVVAGLKQSAPFAVIIAVVIALVMWSYDRWGQPWAERGRIWMTEHSLRRKN